MLRLTAKRPESQGATCGGASTGQGSTWVALVDDEDYDLVSGFNWYAQRHGRVWYALRYLSGLPRKRVRMHRVLVPEWPAIDHINHNGLDNRRRNLRPATHSQQMQNTRRHEGSSSRFKGVHWHIGKQEWRAKIQANNRVVHIGQYRSEVDAALAYDRAARELHGEFAVLNFPEVTP